MDKSERKRSGPLLWLGRRSMPVWICVALLPALYVASFGPACWLTATSVPGRAGLTRGMIVFWPLGRLASLDCPPYTTALIWWMTIGAPPDSLVKVQIDPRDNAYV